MHEPAWQGGEATTDAVRRRADALRGQIEARLQSLTPTGSDPLAAAVRHSLLAPGKRLRPILTALSAEHFGGDSRLAIDPGCAIEMVHTASLVFDDLPCMDDAALRRGRPTVHTAFGEPAALLAGVALLNEAFGVLARSPSLPDDARLALVARLSAAVGFDGLVTGQLRDLEEPEQSRSAQALASLNHQKTGVLFVAACETGAVVAGADAKACAAAREFGRRIGQAFQIRDDLIDVGAGLSDASKDAGKDADKTTLVSLVGAERARAALDAELEAGLAALAEVGGSGPLTAVAAMMFETRAVAA
jgi:geranylgeranyl pyrophosphate synthase